MSKKTKASNYFGDCGMGNDSCYLWILMLLALNGNNNNGFGNILGLGNNNPVSTIVLLMLLCGAND